MGAFVKARKMSEGWERSSSTKLKHTKQTCMRRFSVASYLAQTPSCARVSPKTGRSRTRRIYLSHHRLQYFTIALTSGLGIKKTTDTHIDVQAAPPP